MDSSISQFALTNHVHVNSIPMLCSDYINKCLISPAIITRVWYRFCLIFLIILGGFRALLSIINKRCRILKGQSKMNNPEKLATQDTQHEEKQNKNTTRNVLDTTMLKQAQIPSIRNDTSYKQVEVKTNRPSFVCENRNGYHNTELRT